MEIVRDKPYASPVAGRDPSLATVTLFATLGLLVSVLTQLAGWPLGLVPS
jgi:hypothetical protein